MRRHVPALRVSSTKPEPVGRLNLSWSSLPLSRWSLARRAWPQRTNLWRKRTNPRDGLRATKRYRSEDVGEANRQILPCGPLPTKALAGTPGPLFRQPVSLAASPKWGLYIAAVALRNAVAGAAPYSSKIESGCSILMFAECGKTRTGTAWASMPSTAFPGTGRLWRMVGLQIRWTRQLPPAARNLEHSDSATARLFASIRIRCQTAAALAPSDVSTTTGW